MIGDLRSKWGRKLHGYLLDNCVIIVVVGDKMSLYCDPILTTHLQLIASNDQINITTNPKGEKASAKGLFFFSFLFFFLFFFFLSFFSPSFSFSFSFSFSLFLSFPFPFLSFSLFLFFFRVTSPKKSLSDCELGERGQVLVHHRVSFREAEMD